MPTPYPAPGRPCTRGDITAAVLHDDLFLVRYDCTQLESCLDSRVLRTNLDPLLQQPLPAECQQVVKAKLMQVRWGPALRSRRVSGGWPDPPHPVPHRRSTPAASLRISCGSSPRWPTSTPVRRSASGTSRPRTRSWPCCPQMGPWRTRLR